MYKKFAAVLISIAVFTVSNFHIIPVQSFALPAHDASTSAEPAEADTSENNSEKTYEYLDINANQWFYPFVKEIKGLSLLTGDVPLLKPYDTTSLEEILTLLQAQDKDIASMSEAVLLSKEAKVADDNSALNRPSTREDLYNAVGKYFGIESSKKHYSDTTSVYANGILENNIITPFVHNNKYVFYPKRLATRAEAIVLIEKVRKFKNNPEPIAPRAQKPVYLPVLIYHEITEGKEKLAKSPGLFVSPEKFKQDVQAFQKSGYTTVTFEEVKAFYDGYIGLPEKPYIISIDDGYKGNYTYGFSIAKELNAKFVVSLVADTISRPSSYSDAYSSNAHLTEKDIWEMHSSGLVEFQSHTYNLHKDFGSNNTGNGVSPFKSEAEADYWFRVQSDLQKSSGVIRYLTGYTPCVLTYPMGIHNGLVENLASKNGYFFTLTIEKGVNNLQNGPTKLKRINVSNWLKSEELLKTAQQQ